jgi:hypothetical protein
MGPTHGLSPHMRLPSNNALTPSPYLTLITLHIIGTSFPSFPTPLFPPFHGTHKVSKNKDPPRNICFKKKHKQTNKQTNQMSLNL